MLESTNQTENKSRMNVRYCYECQLLVTLNRLLRFWRRRRQVQQAGGAVVVFQPREPHEVYITEYEVLLQIEVRNKNGVLSPK